MFRRTSPVKECTPKFEISTPPMTNTGDGEGAAGGKDVPAFQKEWSGWSNLKEMVHGEFTVATRADIKKYVFVPPAVLTSEDFIPKLLRHWKLKAPNLIMQLYSSSFIDTELVHNEVIDKEIDFAKLKMAAIHTVPKNAQAPAGNQEAAAHRKLSKEVFKNRLLEVMGNIVCASETSNCWFSASTYATVSHNLFEEAMARSRSSPTVLVVDDPFMQHHTAPWEESEICVDGDENWNAALTHKLFKNGKNLNERATSVELPDNMGEYFFTVSEGQRIFPRWSWRGASHYIFTENISDFHLDKLAPTGCVFMGGTSFTRDAIFSALRLHQPCVFLKYMRNMGHEMAKVLELKEKYFKDHSLTTPEVAGMIYQELELTRGDGTRFSMSHLIEILDRSLEHKAHFNDINIVVNAMKDTSHSVIDRISKCFATAISTMIEVGAGPADKSAVKVAWVLHNRMENNAFRQRFYSNVQLLLSLALSLLATLASLLMQFLVFRFPTHIAGRWSRWWPFAQASVVVFPACATIASTLAISLKSESKFSSLHGAAAMLQRDIWRFRMRVDEFGSAKKPEPALDVGYVGDGPKNDSGNASAMARAARMRFAARVQALSRLVQMGDMSEDHFQNILAEEIGSSDTSRFQVTKDSHGCVGRCCVRVRATAA
ncbi:unnamed protein product [Polarella glacialis]|uniref:Uncharacterized protein n=1 Tax=Polarella glacialis TaxID=89957 RepID=A0A813HHV6_POLGL|nr:unnamed protein product [Polarella glacialis]CAE8663655.1 unnamed protein product [Polarella glacialis]